MCAWRAHAVCRCCNPSGSLGRLRGIGITVCTNGVCEEPCGPIPGKAPVYVTDLLPASPNPFNRDTHIRFSLAEADEITLRVYDVNGRTVRTIAGGFSGRGMHDLVWDRRDDTGRELASGVYFIGLRTQRHHLTQKVVVVK